MKNAKLWFALLLFAAASAQAGGAASVVAKKSTAKGFKYSWQTKDSFIDDCVRGANERVCYCVFGKIQQQYSEIDYWRLENDLQKNIDHPDYMTFLTTAVEECDKEYTEGGFNKGYAEGGARGIGNGRVHFFGGGGGGVATKAKGNVKTPSARDVGMGFGGGSRSAADIMKVVRQRTPGLRHIYNKFLKKKPGFQGKISLKFTIAPDGSVISISIASSTTGYDEFDAQVKSAVSRWTFEKVKSGNTTVTVPFTFSE